MGRLNKFQEAFKIERLKSRKEIDNGMLIAKERVEILEKELKKESDFMDNEIGSLKNEIQEWQKENEYMANKLHGQEEVIIL